MTITAAPERPSAVEAGRFEYVTPNDVYAVLRDGGTIRVEEFPAGDLLASARRVSGKDGVLLLHIDQDIDGSHDDTVSMHPDESDRLALFDRAIEALQNARAALVAVGYVDYAEIRRHESAVSA